MATKVGLSDTERRAGRENYDFYCFLIWPFIEASWLAAVSLLGLTPRAGGGDDGWVEMARAQESCQLVSLEHVPLMRGGVWGRSPHTTGVWGCNPQEEKRGSERARVCR